MSNSPLNVGAADLLDLVWFWKADWPAELAELVLEEPWDDEGNGQYPILTNYVRYYVRRAGEEGVWMEGVSPEGLRVSAFDTGLLSKHFEPVYAVFEENKNPGRQPWVHKEWAVPSSGRMRDFDLAALRRVVFFTDPAEAVYDPRLPVIPNLEHILDDNVDRYPAELQQNQHLRRAALEHAIHVAAAKARSNWRLAAPQFYWPKWDSGHIQLLLPLALMAPDRVDLALVVDRDPPYAQESSPTNACYRAFTVLPLEWAYRNARLVTRPEAYWLDIESREAVAAAD
jgi:Domain of unknown function (DUF3825)